MELWHNDYCMGVAKPEAGTKVVLFKCQTKDALQKWEHSRVRTSKMFLHVILPEVMIQGSQNRAIHKFNVGSTCIILG